MKKTAPTPLRSLTLATLATCAMTMTGQAQADNHALIMTIDYQGTYNFLPGIDKDGDMAVKIAQSMGIPSQNIKRLGNSDLTLSGISRALQDLISRIHEDDKVFLYYSGHGYQGANESGSKCSEALVTSDRQYFHDVQLSQSLEALAAKASQVVMFNDSCFSGGAATKDLSRNANDPVPKVYVAQSSDAIKGYVCGHAVNKEFRNLGVVDLKHPPQTLYVAAAAPNEVSFATTNGSWATQAWATCLSGSSADRDGNGIVDGNELRDCSQRILNAAGRQQTISLLGSTSPSLPVSFIGSGSGGAPTPVAHLNKTLESLRAAADPSMSVDLSITNDRLTINKDNLDFTVTTQQSGYLHLLHVASDGKFYVLFPNKLDQNNNVQSGTHRFPRARWAIQAQGPMPGTSYLMAYLSKSPRDFSKDMEVEGPFAMGNANTDTTKTLGIVALSGRYGASTVAAIQEVK